MYALIIVIQFTASLPPRIVETSHRSSSLHESFPASYKVFRKLSFDSLLKTPDLGPMKAGAYKIQHSIYSRYVNNASDIVSFDQSYTTTLQKAKRKTTSMKYSKYLNPFDLFQRSCCRVLRTTCYQLVYSFRVASTYCLGIDYYVVSHQE